MYFILIFLSLLILELLYFRIADKYNIIDHPNERSSHTRVTLRGGGIIFPISVLIYCLVTGNYMWFAVGIFLISLISFWDDVKGLPNLIRVSVHFLSVVLLIHQLQIAVPFWVYPVIFIVIIGILNAYNFMDGINGITGGYSLIALITLLFINHRQAAFTDNTLIVYILLAILVFNIFNFRKKAKCFAGDIGSISIAFAICFLISELIINTGDFKYILLLLIYGLDTISTIIFRLIRKENIFEAHRSHFYQYLANEKRWPHLLVAILYSLVQLGVNMLVIASNLNGYVLMVLVTLSGFGFILLRLVIEGKKRLIGA